jgi:DNA repair protein RadA
MSTKSKKRKESPSVSAVLPNEAGVTPIDAAITDPKLTRFKKPLKEAGYYTAERICSMSAKELIGVRGLSEETASKIYDIAKSICHTEYACSGWDLHQLQKSGWNADDVNEEFTDADKARFKSQRQFHIKTGCDQVDNALNGGFSSKEVNEIYGPAACGKSQFCDQLAANASTANFCGKPGRVMFVDTERTSYMLRYLRMCDRMKVDLRTTLKNMDFRRPLTSDQQFADDLLDVHRFIDKQQSEGIPYAAVIVDSFIKPFRIFQGRGELAPRQQAIAKCLDILMRIAVSENVVVLITNHVIANPDQGGLNKYAVKYVPAGGHVIGHTVTNRFSVRKGGNHRWVLKMEDVPHLDNIEIAFAITESGVHDESYDPREDKNIEHFNQKYESSIPQPIVVEYKGKRKTKGDVEENDDVAVSSSSSSSVTTTTTAAEPVIDADVPEEEMKLAVDTATVDDDMSTILDQKAEPKPRKRGRHAEDDI